MVELIKKLFKKQTTNQDFSEALEDIPSPTSQQSLDSEQPAWFARERLVLPPFNLTDFLNLYLTDSLAKALIDSATNLTVSPLQPVSEDDELNKYVLEFIRRTDLDSILWQLCRDSNLFGFGCAEIVGNGSSLQNSNKILGLKRLDPRFIVIEKDPKGNYDFFRQRPGTVLNSGSSMYDRPLDPQTIVFVQNYSPLTVYGHSMLQSISERIKQRNALLKSAVQAARNHANPVLHLHYQLPDNGIQIDPKETLKQRKAMSEQIKKVDAGSRWLVTAGIGTYTSAALGNNSLPDISNLIASITEEIIVSCGISPSSLGFSLGGKSIQTAEGSNKITINTIISHQRNLTNQLENKLFSILQFIEPDCPSGEIILNMQEPTAETLKERYEAETVNINNVILKGKSGIISAQTASQELGYEAIEDEEKWNAMTDPSPIDPNENDPNQSQATRSAILKSNNDNGNNPTGGK